MHFIHLEMFVKATLKCICQIIPQLLSCNIAKLVVSYVIESPSLPRFLSSKLPKRDWGLRRIPHNLFCGFHGPILAEMPTYTSWLGHGPSRTYPFAGEIRLIFSRLSVRTRSREQMELIAVIFAFQHLRSRSKCLSLQCFPISIAISFRI